MPARMRNVIIGSSLPDFLVAAVPDAVLVEDAETFADEGHEESDWYDLAVIDRRDDATGGGATRESVLEVLKPVLIDDIIWVEDGCDGPTMTHGSWFFPDRQYGHEVAGAVAGVAASRPLSPTNLRASLAVITDRPVVLLVDSEPDVRRLYGLLLRYEGLRTTGAPNGRDGLEKAREQRPAVIVTNIMMPVMDGWQVLEALKVNPATKDIPAIVFATKVQDEEVARGYALGCVDYIKMPVPLSEYVDRIRRWLPDRPKG